MKIDVGIAGPPHRDTAVAELRCTVDDGITIPAEVFVEHGRTMIAFFRRSGGVEWEFEVAEILQAIGSAMSALHR